MKISRKDFLKAGVVGSATLGVSGSLFSTSKWFNKAVNAEETSVSEKLGYTFHLSHCGGPCAMMCTVRDGKLVKIQPNKWPDMNFSTVCLKGLSEVQRIYSPERLRTPLKRSGKRGEGKFIPISWDEALTTIADKIKELQNNYGKESILVATSGESAFKFLPALIGAQYSSGAGVDTGIANGIEEATGDLYFGVNTNEVMDWVNSKVIINLGSNEVETGLLDAQWFLKAKEAGAYTVTIDPHFTATAAKSHKWIPIRPGSDAALILAMITIIIDNNWYQEDFLKKNTSIPFLIRSDNQKLLRLDMFSDDADAATNPFLVWDEISNSFKPYNEEGISPKLDGEFLIGDLKVKTVFSELKERQKKYTVEWAEEITEINKEVIVELAEKYALGGAACITNGWGGADKFGNSHVLGHALAILAGLTGNIGRVGGGFGCSVAHYTNWPVSLGSWNLPEQFKTTPLEMYVYEMRSKPNSVRMVINTGDTFQQYYANMNVTRKWIDSLDFIVTVDVFHNTSAEYSDIILPACSRFETEGDYGLLTVAKHHVLLQQKVLDPLFDAKTDFQIEKELAEKLGLSQFLPKDHEEYIRALLNSDDPALKGITLEGLVANNGVLRMNLPNEPYRKFMDQVYYTNSKKLELYFERMIDTGHSLPEYEEPLEAYPHNPLREKYPLQFSQSRTKYRIHSQFMNASWINQYQAGPKLELNPKDGKKRNLKNDDIVEVFNDRGSIQCRYQENNAVRPGSARFIEGWWSRYMINGNFQDLTNDSLNEKTRVLRYGPVIPFNDTLVEVRKV